MYTKDMLNKHMDAFIAVYPELAYNSKLGEGGRIECDIYSEEDSYVADAFYIGSDIIDDEVLCESLVSVRLECVAREYEEFVYGVGMND